MSLNISELSPEQINSISPEIMTIIQQQKKNKDDRKHRRNVDAVEDLLAEIGTMNELMPYDEKMYFSTKLVSPQPMRLFKLRVLTKPDNYSDLTLSFINKKLKRISWNVILVRDGTFEIFREDIYGISFDKMIRLCQIPFGSIEPVVESNLIIIGEEFANHLKMMAIVGGLF